MYLVEQGDKESLIKNNFMRPFFKTPTEKILERTVKWELHGSSFNDAGEDFTELTLIDANGDIICKERSAGY